MDTGKIWAELEDKGFSVVDNVFNQDEVSLLISALEDTSAKTGNFRISNDLFAIRQLLNEIPGLLPIIFNGKMVSLIKSWPGADYFISKAIYFNKPEQSNWVVAWHRDLTINVRDKTKHPEYKRWIKKDGQYSVQPPTHILNRNVTIRIHLDETNGENGALKVLPGSHKTEDSSQESTNIQEYTVPVMRGGIMLMKPLLLHASGRTTNGHPRRVIHLEFSNCTLPSGVDWSEYMKMPSGR